MVLWYREKLNLCLEEVLEAVSCSPCFPFPGFVIEWFLVLPTKFCTDFPQLQFIPDSLVLPLLPQPQGRADIAGTAQKEPAALPPFLTRCTCSCRQAVTHCTLVSTLP